jgi:hypothetical protein
MRKDRPAQFEADGLLNYGESLKDFYRLRVPKIRFG